MVLGLLAQFLIVLVRSSSVEPLLVLVTPELSPDRALFAVLNIAFLVAQLVVLIGSVCVVALMLACGYVLTGELTIPIGHFTWNFFQRRISRIFVLQLR